MEWYIYLARFGAGVFLANGVPHFVHGISGNKFQSPFASPPAVGESSPVINVIWGMVNFVIGYILLYGPGAFRVGLNMDMLIVGIGILFAAVMLSGHFERVRHP
jgi:hypothetical protein